MALKDWKRTEKKYYKYLWKHIVTKNSVQIVDDTDVHVLPEYRGWNLYVGRNPAGRKCKTLSQALKFVKSYMRTH